MVDDAALSHLSLATEAVVLDSGCTPESPRKCGYLDRTLERLNQEHLGVELRYDFYTALWMLQRGLGVTAPQRASVDKVFST